MHKAEVASVLVLRSNVLAVVANAVTWFHYRHLHYHSSYPSCSPSQAVACTAVSTALMDVQPDMFENGFEDGFEDHRMGYEATAQRSERMD